MRAPQLVHLNLELVEARMLRKRSGGHARSFRQAPAVGVSTASDPSIAIEISRASEVTRLGRCVSVALWRAVQEPSAASQVRRAAGQGQDLRADIRRMESRDEIGRAHV